MLKSYLLILWLLGKYHIISEYTKGCSWKSISTMKASQSYVFFLPACKVQRTTITTSTWKISENFHYWRFLKFKSCEVGLLSETTQHGSFFVKSKSVHQLKGCHRSSRQGSMHSVVVQHVPKGSKARQKQHLAAMSSITKNVQRLGDIHSSLVSILNNKILYLMWAIPFMRQMFV